jgi:hypothetical protein
MMVNYQTKREAQEARTALMQSPTNHAVPYESLYEAISLAIAQASTKAAATPETVSQNT